MARFRASLPFATQTLKYVSLLPHLVPKTSCTNYHAAPQSETVLIQRVYTHFKKAPPTHKLGVLYVVDSVTRAWVEQARKAGQAFGPSAPDGTFAAGVNRVTELLPSFMTDIIANAPEEQKVRFLESSFEAIDQLAGSIGVSIIAAILTCLNEAKLELFSPVFCMTPKLTYFLRIRLGF